VSILYASVHVWYYEIDYGSTKRGMLI